MLESFKLPHMKTYQQLPAAAQYTGELDKGEIELACIGTDELPIVYADKYVTLVNDPVKFPSGRTGNYLRMFTTSELSGQHGVVIVPIIDEKLVLLRLFRHPTRSWEYEFPRGFAEAGQTDEENARRETHEELGITDFELKPIGTCCPNTGILVTCAEVFVARLNERPVVGTEDGIEEAIANIILVTEAEFRAMVAEGKIRCGFTLSAYTIASVRGLI